MPVDNSAEVARMYASFRVPFIDHDWNCARALRFFRFCSVMGAEEFYYSKSCAIVQSSGSGKSRLIANIAEMLPVFYMCERKAGDTGYPETLMKIIGKLAYVHPEADSRTCDLYIYLRCVAFYQTAAKFAAAIKTLVSLNAYVSEPYEIGYLLFG